MEVVGGEAERVRAIQWLCCCCGGAASAGIWHPTSGDALMLMLSTTRTPLPLGVLQCTAG